MKFLKFETRRVKETLGEELYSTIILLVNEAAKLTKTKTINIELSGTEIVFELIDGVVWFETDNYDEDDKLDADQVAEEVEVLNETLEDDTIDFLLGNAGEPTLMSFGINDMVIQPKIDEYPNCCGAAVINDLPTDKQKLRIFSLLISIFAKNKTVGNKNSQWLLQFTDVCKNSLSIIEKNENVEIINKWVNPNTFNELYMAQVKLGKPKKGVRSK
jgi:hypothetical protein